MKNKYQIKGYVEITETEYHKLPENEGLQIWGCSESEYSFFKKIQEFPIVYENDIRRIEVHKDFILMRDKEDGDNLNFAYNQSFPLLLEAVKKAEEVMKLNEERNRKNVQNAI